MEFGENQFISQFDSESERKEGAQDKIYSFGRQSWTDSICFIVYYNPSLFTYIVLSGIVMNGCKCVGVVAITAAAVDDVVVLMGQCNVICPFNIFLILIKW